MDFMGALTHCKHLMREFTARTVNTLQLIPPQHTVSTMFQLTSYCTEQRRTHGNHLLTNSTHNMPDQRIDIANA